MEANIAFMEEEVRDRVIVYVDPSCPFAWITSRWLAEVERLGAIDLEVRLLSLSVVNEQRQLDAWYREFNDHAWGPARVMAATLATHGRVAGRRFYEAFGETFHVALDTADDLDRDAISASALVDAGLPADLIAAATDATWDDTLRAITSAAIDSVGLDVGVPVVAINGTISSGPVLSSVPRNEQAVALYDAMRTLAYEPGFMRMERARCGELQTA